MPHPVGQLLVHASTPRSDAQLVPTQFSAADELVAGKDVVMDVIAQGCVSSGVPLASRQAAALRRTAQGAWTLEGAMCFAPTAQPVVPDCAPKVLHYQLGKLPAGNYLVRSGALTLNFTVPSVLPNGAVSVGDYTH
jgi:hypothetical protein